MYQSAFDSAKDCPILQTNTANCKATPSIGADKDIKQYLTCYTLRPEIGPQLPCLTHSCSPSANLRDIELLFTYPQLTRCNFSALLVLCLVLIHYLELLHFCHSPLIIRSLNNKLHNKILEHSLNNKLQCT